jgi:hypothetical protein
LFTGFSLDHNAPACSKSIAPAQPV